MLKSCLQALLPCLLLLLPAAAAAQDRMEALPPQLEEVGIDEKRGDTLPLHLPFKDEDGRNVRLGDYFDGEKPVIFVLAYFSCPTLCSLVINGALESLEAMSWDAGTKYRIVIASIDPKDTPTAAKLKKQELLRLYDRRGAEDGWHLLTASEPVIKRLADAAGFRYKYLPEVGEYSHAATMMICTPKGELSRYLYGVRFPPETVRLSMVEASEGKVGSALDQLILFCFHYDATAGVYSVAAMNVMRLGGAVTVVLLAAVLGVYFRREARARKSVAKLVDPPHHPLAAH